MIFVLYVDDCLPLMNVICRFLERKDEMIVETSCSPEEASRMLNYLSFDIIITDYNSKESARIDLLRQTRQKGIMTPFIFFTLEQNRELEREARQYGRVTFTPKFLNMGSAFCELEAIIRAMVTVPHSEGINQHNDLFSSIQGGPQS